MRINRSSRFRRAFKKASQNIQNDFVKKIKIFVDSPYNPILRTHKLKGKLRECYAFCLKDGFRVLFKFVGESEVNLIALGSHDDYNKWKID